MLNVDACDGPCFGPRHCEEVQVEVTLDDFPNIVQMSNAFLSEEWHVVPRKMRLIPMTEGNSLQCYAGYVW